MSDQAGLPRPVMITAVALCGLLALGVAALGLIFGAEERTGDDANRDRQPLSVPSVPAPHAESQRCRTAIEALPANLLSSGEKLRRLRLAEPAPPATVAWGGADHEPVILRCGVQRPGELSRTSPLRDISGVRWLVVERPGTATWYVVDRGVYIALTLPGDSGTGPLQTVSKVIQRALSQRPLEFN